MGNKRKWLGAVLFITGGALTAWTLSLTFQWINAVRDFITMPMYVGVIHTPEQWLRESQQITLYPWFLIGPTIGVVLMLIGIWIDELIGIWIDEHVPIRGAEEVQEVSIGAVAWVAVPEQGKQCPRSVEAIFRPDNRGGWRLEELRSHGDD